MNGGPVYSGSICMKLLEAEPVSGKLCPTLPDCDNARSTIVVSETGRCVLHKRRLFATDEWSTNTKMMNFFVPVQSKSDIKQKVWVGKVLLLFSCREWGIEKAIDWLLYSFWAAYRPGCCD